VGNLTIRCYLPAKNKLKRYALLTSDVVFPEKYFLGNFPENFWKFSGNFPKKRKIFLNI